MSKKSKTKPRYQAANNPEPSPPPGLGKVGYSKLRKDYKKIRPAIVAPEEQVDMNWSEHAYSSLGIGNASANINRRINPNIQKIPQSLKNDNEKVRQEQLSIQNYLNRNKKPKQKYLPHQPVPPVKKDITYASMKMSDGLMNRIDALRKKREEIYESRTKALIKD
jgi:hypothetical protein